MFGFLVTRCLFRCCRTSSDLCLFLCASCFRVLCVPYGAACLLHTCVLRIRSVFVLLSCVVSFRSRNRFSSCSFAVQLVSLFLLSFSLAQLLPNFSLRFHADSELDSLALVATNVTPLLRRASIVGGKRGQLPILLCLCCVGCLVAP